MNQEVKMSKWDQQVLELTSQECISRGIAQEEYLRMHALSSRCTKLLQQFEEKLITEVIRNEAQRLLLNLHVTTIIFLTVLTSAIAQDPIMDVEGDMKIRGSLDLIHDLDTTSIFIGKNAGNLSGLTLNNIAIGIDAGLNTDIGNENIFFGHRAGQKNSVGFKNLFIGYESGHSNTTGFHNSFFGWFSGNQSKQGFYNAFVGTASGIYITNGTRNTYLGAFSGTMPSSDVNELIDRSIAIGYNAKVDCDNCAVLGGIDLDAVKVGIGIQKPLSPLHVKQNEELTSDALVILEGIDNNELTIKDIGGTANLRFVTIDQNNDAWELKVKATADNTPEDRAKMIITYGPDSLFRLDGAGDAHLSGMLTEHSDMRLKTNIKPISNVLPALLELHAYTYDWKSGSLDNNTQIGLLAQEVQKHFPELVHNEGGTLSVSYTRLVPLLLQGLREQEDRLRRLEKIIENQN